MENISIKENYSSKENINNIHSKKKISKDKISLNNKPKKRTREYSPTMDIEEEKLSKNKDKNYINIRNKRMKVPLRKLVGRIHLDEKEEHDQKNINKMKSKENNNNTNNNNSKKNKKRGIKIFSDMSVSEISNNLFKNYYPCLIPPYYPDQIQEQIIDNQIEKLISNINQKKDEKKIEKEIKITSNMNYLRELAEKEGEWITNENYDDNIFYDKEDNDDEDYDKSDSNDERNSNNTYPEDESIENEDEEKDYNDYDDYDNNDDYDEDDY